MKHYAIHPPRLLILACALLSGCENSRSSVDRVVTRGLDATDRYVAESGSPAPTASSAPPRPVALIDGRTITLEQLRPALIEAAGAEVLEEALLDDLLAREAEARQLVISREQIDAEKSLLLETFTGNGLARSPDEAARLLQSIRAARGLGDARFAALLKRNATLRALVAPDVSITESAIDQARELRYGQRYSARLIVVPTAAQATEALEALNKGEEFSQLAARISIDPSAERGGVLEPISIADPAYPSGVRAALRTLQEGAVSQPIAIDQGFAILRLDDTLPATTPPADDVAARPLLERDVRTQQERLLMNQLARRMLESASISIMDRTLDEAWNSRTKR